MKEIFTRRSIRKFDTNKKVDSQLLIKIVKAGFYAPSARNQQPRSFVIIDDENIIKELSLVSKGSMILTDAKYVIAVIGDDPNNLTTPDMEAQDLSASVMNILLEARHFGLGTCWIGIYPRNDRITKANQILNVKNNSFVFALIAIGYPVNESDFCELDRYNKERVFFNRC